MFGGNIKMGTTKNYYTQKQLQSLLNVYSRFARMGIFTSCTEDQVIDSFLPIVRYGVKYFSIKSLDVLEFWSKMFSFKVENPHWREALLIIEICLCAPVSNASLEGLFSQMTIIKSHVRNRLSVKP